ncbi:mycothiol synthase [Nocardiopsis sediminis]|uniref:Mycothiol acetyltransferase n=1 Tax=Nocardiopsis sediminis TaxID=1778267 RepID=A0ABV8FU72_9ACTN
MNNVRITGRLDEREADGVVALAEEAQRHDGVAPLSEQTLLRVRHGAADGSARFHLLYDEPGARPAGFAFAQRTPGEPDSGELVVAPARRRRGHGAALLGSLAADTSPSGLRVWAHGRLDGAVALARSAGWRQVRGLFKMRLRLDGEAPAELPEPVLRPEVRDRVRLRTFVPGADEDAWLRVNGAAFADHPEQGALTRTDLLEREAEDWFDPEGFFLAEDAGSGALAGFHWTKVHADGAGLADVPVGEVYVVGVDPAWQGTGLGRALTVAGLRYLRDRGLPWVLLYTDEENRSAVRLYESLGFRVFATDVMYATSSATPHATSGFAHTA